MAKSVNSIIVSNWTDTGATTKMDRYTFDLRVEYTEDDGTPRVHEGNYTYPNDLSDVPLSVRKKWATEQIEAKVRVQLGVLEWSQIE